jgi:hypothetical protein
VGSKADSTANVQAAPQNEGVLSNPSNWFTQYVRPAESAFFIVFLHFGFET